MAKGALYFPYIQVPDSAWFTRALLYWDTVGSIMPSSHVYDRSLLSARMRELVDKELVRCIVPDHDRDHAEVGFDAAFLELLGEESSIFLTQGRERFAAGDARRLHSEKTGQSLIAQLADRGLARHAEGPEHDSWWEVEAVTADLFMAYLATTLGQQEDIDMSPVTDSIESLEAFRYVATPEPPRSARQGGVAYECALDAQRTALLTLTLPTPRNPVSASELVKFRAKHGKLLPAFRAHLERKVLEIAPEEDDTERDRRLKRLVKDDLAEELEEIRGRLRERSWTEDPAGSALKVLTPVGGAAAGVLATGSFVAAPIAAPLVLLAVLSVRRRNNKEDLRSPLAYAAVAAEKLAAQR